MIVPKILCKRARSYRSVFSSEGADRVLGDLKRYCRGGQTTFDSDAHKMAFLAGRQDVFNRIVAHCALTEQQVAQIEEDSARAEAQQEHYGG